MDGFGYVFQIKRKEPISVEEKIDENQLIDFYATSLNKTKDRNEVIHDGHYRFPSSLNFPLKSNHEEPQNTCKPWRDEEHG
ncbi:MAG: hypothetical protein QW328_07540 [Nitrososphaerota archaeon]